MLETGNTMNQGGGDGAGSGGGEQDIVTKMMDMFNRGFTAREQKLTEKFDKKLAEKLGEFSKSMSKTIEDSLLKLVPSGGGEGGKGKSKGEGASGGEGGGSHESDRRMNTLEKTVQSLQTELDKSRQKETALREKARAQNLRTTLREAFHKHGLTDDARVRGAIALWLEEGRARYASEDDDAAVVAVERDKTELDIDVGVASWFRTEEGRSFLPPMGPRGSGDGRGQPGLSSKGKTTTVEQAAGAIQRWINGEIGGI